MTADVTELTELQIAAHRTGDVLLAQRGKGPAKGTTPTDVEALWRSYATVYTRVSRKHRAQFGVMTAKPAADAAIKQMLRIGEAQTLVQDVRKLRRKAIRITVEFMDAEELPQNTSRRNENNFFLPNEVDRGRCKLFPFGW